MSTGWCPVRARLFFTFLPNLTSRFKNFPSALPQRLEDDGLQLGQLLAYIVGHADARVHSSRISRRVQREGCDVRPPLHPTEAKRSRVTRVTTVGRASGCGGHVKPRYSASSGSHKHSRLSAAAGSQRRALPKGAKPPCAYALIYL